MHFSGVNASVFLNEVGKHVVQRVPPTEHGGRRQTSVVSVAVLPMAPERTQKLLAEHELEITAFKRAAGPGGQHLQKSATAIRVVHRPTATQVVISTERSQQRNRQIAIRIISAKVLNAKAVAATQAHAQARKVQLGGGTRGDKIRTYNFIESRAVDHRTGKKTTQVRQVIERGRFDLLQ